MTTVAPPSRLVGPDRDAALAALGEQPPGVIVGLDLSLRASAAVAIPLTFSDGIRWPTVTWTTAGYSLPQTAPEVERCARLQSIRDNVLDFVRTNSARHVWLEELAFNQRGAMSRENAGLAWLVKVALIESGCLVRTVPASQARRVFLGNSRRGAKQDVQQALRDIGAPFAESNDLCDAFVIANFAASELGGGCLMLGEAAA